MHRIDSLVGKGISAFYGTRFSHKCRADESLYSVAAKYIQIIPENQISQKQFFVIKSTSTSLLKLVFLL